MTTPTRTANENPGALLGEILVVYRSFMENVHSLMRFLDRELSARNWTLLRPGGTYGVTRDGYGASFSAFSSWMTTHAGLVFVEVGQTAFGPNANSITKVKETGLQLLVFQIRWLDKSPNEPVAWYAKLRVERDGVADDPRWQDRKWEDYQSDVLGKLEPEVLKSGISSGNIKSGRVSKGLSIVFTGRYSEVPVVQLQSTEDAVSLLVSPALEMWSQD